MFVPALHATLTAIVILWIAAFVADKSAWGQQSDELAILRTQADALAKEGKRKEAFVAHRTLASRAEQAEIAAAGKAGTKTGEALGNLAWHAVLAEQFQEALAAADRGLLLAPELRAIEGNRAHALMFLGRVDEARAIHLWPISTANRAATSRPCRFTGARSLSVKRCWGQTILTSLVHSTA
jgi:hypothetical protein